MNIARAVTGRHRNICKRNVQWLHLLLLNEHLLCAGTVLRPRSQKGTGYGPYS